MWWRLELTTVNTTPRISAIVTKNDLATAIGVPLELVQRRAFEAVQFGLYHSFTARKRSGELRTIHVPHWPLKNIQLKILNLLEEIYRPSPRAMGFIKKRGVKSNAEMHVAKRLILNFDLSDYFPSIHFGRIRGRLRSAPYNISDDVELTAARNLSKKI